ncbi:hypothetical protein K490DRAFT_56679 [Saccharata proteae CBS 121410]|uniref:Uncharacterized protein n=1 Tax=Saccharata proteae CBS 121410 TaxID=1314787 RepID=A0A9P4HXB8_9PEZI|nr:hypothetical protein K490DRAFT_56679 [Saccharata proteae CBS 121410]
MSYLAFSRHVVVSLAFLWWVFANDTASTDTTAHTLTPGVLAAIAVAGCLILVALIWMIFLLVRARHIPPLPTLHPNDVPNKRAWSFSRRSPAPSNIRLHKVRNARLSAIIESPRTVIGSPTPPMPSSIKRKLSSRSTATARERERNEESPPTRSRNRSFSEKRLTPPVDLAKTLKPSPLFSRNKKNRDELRAGSKSSLEQNKPTSAPELIAPLAPLPLFSATDGSLVWISTSAPGAAFAIESWTLEVSQPYGIQPISSIRLKLRVSYKFDPRHRKQSACE